MNKAFLKIFENVRQTNIISVKNKKYKNFISSEDNRKFLIDLFYKFYSHLSNEFDCNFDDTLFSSSDTHQLIYDDRLLKNQIFIRFCRLIVDNLK